jgi:hypothetical protein
MQTELLAETCRKANDTTKPLLVLQVLTLTSY